MLSYVNDKKTSDMPRQTSDMPRQTSDMPRHEGRDKNNVDR